MSYQASKRMLEKKVKGIVKINNQLTRNRQSTVSLIEREERDFNEWRRLFPAAVRTNDTTTAIRDAQEIYELN